MSENPRTSRDTQEDAPTEAVSDEVKEDAVKASGQLDAATSRDADATDGAPTAQDSDG